jgi:hypothetical protein
LTATERVYSVLLALFQEKNLLKRCLSRKGESGFTVPGSPVDPESVIGFSDNHPVIAEDCHAASLLPFSCQSSLSGPRMGWKQKSPSLMINSTGMDDNPFTLRQVLSNQKL